MHLHLTYSSNNFLEEKLHLKRKCFISSSRRCLTFLNCIILKLNICYYIIRFKFNMIVPDVQNKLFELSYWDNIPMIPWTKSWIFLTNWICVSARRICRLFNQAEDKQKNRAKNKPWRGNKINTTRSISIRMRKYYKLIIISMSSNFNS